MAAEENGEQVSEVEAQTLSSLCSQLDGLWAQYLDLLDAYTSSQAAIQKHMSSGFFSVAQANFKSTRGRYGQDYYDERAVATARVAIATKDDGLFVDVRRIDAIPDQQPDEGSTKDRTQEKASMQSASIPVSTEKPATQQPTPEATPEPDFKKDNADNSPPVSIDANDDQLYSADPEEADKTPKVDLRDPIRWFGILVPPALRQAQGSFTTAVLDKDAITKAVNSSRRLREVEVEIRKLRKAIKKAEKTLEVREDLPVRKEVEAAL